MAMAELNVAETVTCTAELREDLAAAVDRNAREAEQVEALREYGAPDGKWKYAPPEARKKAETALTADQDRRAGVALWRLRRHLAMAAPQVKAAIETARLAPDVEEVLQIRTGKRGGSLEAIAMLETLDELRLARHDRELGPAAPSTVLRAYQRASEDPTLQCNATLIRYTEHRHGDGWRGRPSEAQGETEAATALHRKITAAREARIPSELSDLASAIETASGFAAKVEALGTRPVRGED